jgi:hypothetical protein
MLLSLLLFAVTLSLLEMYRGWFASSELKTIAGGFVSSLLFLLLLTVRPPLFPFYYCGGWRTLYDCLSCWLAAKLK